MTNYWPPLLLRGDSPCCRPTPLYRFPNQFLFEMIAFLIFPPFPSSFPPLLRAPFFLANYFVFLFIDSIVQEFQRQLLPHWPWRPSSPSLPRLFPCLPYLPPFPLNLFPLDAIALTIFGATRKLCLSFNLGFLPRRIQLQPLIFLESDALFRTSSFCKRFDPPFSPLMARVASTSCNLLPPSVNALCYNFCPLASATLLT